MSMIITNYDVKRVLVDNRSSIDILFYDTFPQINLSKNQFRRVSISLIGFYRDSNRVEEEITLPITTGSPPQQATIHLTFMAIWIPLAYNIILGWPGLNKFDAIVSTQQLLIHFLIWSQRDAQRSATSLSMLHYGNQGAKGQ